MTPSEMCVPAAYMLHGAHKQQRIMLIVLLSTKYRVVFMSISVEILRCCALGAEVFLTCFGQIGFNFLQITYWIVFLHVLRTFLLISARLVKLLLALRCLVETLYVMC